MVIIKNYKGDMEIFNNYHMNNIKGDMGIMGILDKGNRDYILLCR